MSQSEAVESARRKARALEENIAKVIVGKAEPVRLSLLPLLCRGHLLLEDVPGIGKTTLAKAIAKSVAGEFRRIQFTPDLLPLDITGSSVFNQKTQDFEFRRGPLFTDILLADEINRATPRTQSSLLECMEEFQISSDGQTYPLPGLFFVIATLNPVEQAGTFPLPETQLDRFLLRIRIGYPSQSEELEIFDRQAETHPIESLQPVLQPEEVVEMRRAVTQVFVEPSVREYMVRIVRQTREHADILLGASPRGTISLIRASQALALLTGENFVTPDIVKTVAPHVLGHRVLLRPQAALRGGSGDDVVREVLRRVSVPVKETAS